VLFATFALPPFPMLPPPPDVLPIAEVVPGCAPVAAPFLPVVPILVLPVVPVAGLLTPGFVPVVVPGLDAFVDECVPVPVDDRPFELPVEGRPVEGCDAGAECEGGAECDGAAACEGALGFGGGGDDFF
jgi:hypothetical protein